MTRRLSKNPIGREESLSNSYGTVYSILEASKILLKECEALELIGLVASWKKQFANSLSNLASAVFDQKINVSVDQVGTMLTGNTDITIAKGKATLSVSLKQKGGLIVISGEGPAIGKFTRIRTDYMGSFQDD